MVVFKQKDPNVPVGMLVSLFYRRSNNNQTVGSSSLPPQKAARRTILFDSCDVAGVVTFKATDGAAASVTVLRRGPQRFRRRRKAAPPSWQSPGLPGYSPRPDCTAFFPAEVQPLSFIR